MGQFDQELDPETGVTLTPDPSLDPLALLALAPPTPPPTASPAMPAPSGPLGPRSGFARGIPGGLLANAQANQQQREEAFKNQQLQYHQQQEELLRQAQIAEIARKNDETRSLQRAKTLETIAKSVPTFETKAEYDRFLDQMGSLLVNSGFRDLSPVMLRSQFPFRPPDAKARAETALKKFFASPFTQDLIKQNGPMSVVNSTLDMGKDEQGRQNPSIPVLDALKLTGTEFPLDMDTSIPLEKLPESEQRIVAAKQQFFDETGRKPTSKDNSEIYKRAREMMKNEADVELARSMHEATLEATRARTAEAKTKADQERAANADIAQQLVDGDIAPSMLSKRTTNYNAILSEANRLSKEQTGKSFSDVNAQLSFEAARRFVGSLNSNQMVRFKSLGGTVVNTIDEVRRLSQLMDQSGIQLLNKAEMGAYAQLNGNSPRGQLVAQYLSAVNTLKEEFANLINGGYAPTEPAFALANQQVNSNYGVKAMTASLIEAQRLIKYRLRGFDELKPNLGGLGPSPAAGPAPAASAREELLRRF